MDTPQQSPSPYTPPVTPAPAVVPPPTSGFSTGKVIGILVAVVVVAAAAYFLFGRSSEEIATVSPSPSTSAATPSTPSQTPDSTTDWKTYRNDQYGFEFKYPSLRWANTGDGVATGVVDPNVIMGAEAISAFGVDLRMPSVVGSKACFSAAATENFEGYPAVRSSRQQNGFTNHTISIDRTDIGKCVDIIYSIYNAKSTPQIVDDLEKILASFKFVSDGWSVYRSEQYSFGLLYPRNFTAHQEGLASKPDDWQGDKKVLEVRDQKGEIALDAWIVTSPSKLNVEGSSPAVIGFSGRWNGAPGCGAYFTEIARGSYTLRVVHYSCGNIFGVEQSERDKLVNIMARQSFWFNDRPNPFPI